VAPIHTAPSVEAAINSADTLSLASAAALLLAAKETVIRRLAEFDMLKSAAERSSNPTTSL
jgi:hypothetical protein